jgi:hypothetical protein
VQCHDAQLGGAGRNVVSPDLPFDHRPQYFQRTLAIAELSVGASLVPVVQHAVKRRTSYTSVL